MSGLILRLLPPAISVIAATWFLFSWAPKHCALWQIVGLAITTSILSMCCLGCIVSAVMEWSNVFQDR